MAPINTAFDFNVFKKNGVQVKEMSADEYIDPIIFTS